MYVIQMLQFDKFDSIVIYVSQGQSIFSST